MKSNPQWKHKQNHHCDTPPGTAANATVVCSGRRWSRRQSTTSVCFCFMWALKHNRRALKTNWEKLKARSWPGCLSGLECRPAYQQAAGLAPGQGTCPGCGSDPWSEHTQPRLGVFGPRSWCAQSLVWTYWEAANRCLSLSLPLSKSNEKYPWERVKNETKNSQKWRWNEKAHNEKNMGKKWGPNKMKRKEWVYKLEEKNCSGRWQAKGAQPAHNWIMEAENRENRTIQMKLKKTSLK